MKSKILAHFRSEKVEVRSMEKNLVSTSNFQLLTSNFATKGSY